MIITIDGPAASGKSTIAKRLAQKLHFSFFDTGAMYRAVTWYLLKNKADLDNEKAIQEILTRFSFTFVTDTNNQKHYFVEGIDVTAAIRSREVTEFVSLVSAKMCVRKTVVPIQREYATHHHVVFEGRDMGTIVFPYAEIKFFLKADIEERAHRRYEELRKSLGEKGDFDFKKILEDLKKRDEIDSSRAISPLRCPEDAFVIDTTNLSVDEAVQKVLQIIKKQKKKLFPKERPFYRFVCFFFRCIFRIFYRYRVYGQYHFFPGKGMIAANHVSYLDPVVIGVSSPEEIHYLAKEPLFSIPILGACIRVLNSHPLTGTTGDKKTFRLIESVLSKGQKVLVFPEGTRSSSEMLGPIMRGIGFLALKTESSILPVYVHGTFKIWGRMRKWPRPWGRIICVFGSSIETEEFHHLERREAISAITDRLTQALQGLQKWVEDGCEGTPP